MLDSYFLLQAMEGIEDEHIREAGEFLGLLEPCRRGRSPSKLLRTLLIAAIIAALFTVTAYAMGWFGLGERIMERPSPTGPALSAGEEKRRWLSLNGYADSPEYKANLEWLDFWHEYTAAHTMGEDPAFFAALDEDTLNTCRFYGVYDRAMLDKLKAIGESYGLALHTRQVTPLSLEDFCLAAGTGEFLPGGEGSGYVYEDGSFKFEGLVYPRGGEPDEGSSFSLTKNLSGALVPLWYPIDAPEEYIQWEYTNAYGDSLLLCFNEEKGKLCILFEAEGIYIQLDCNACGSARDCEALADCFVFHELLKTRPRLETACHGPRAYGDGSAASLTDFLSSPEGRAAGEYYNYARALERSRGPYPPWKDSLLMDKYTALAEDYSLEAAGEPGLVFSFDEDLSVPEGYTRIDPEQFAALGYEPELARQFGLLFICGNGVIQAEGGLASWLYIPKGALSFSLSEAVAADYGEQWLYLTARGETVFIAADLPESERSPVILYETENGWLLGRLSWYHSAYEPEAAADEMDLSLFP